MEKLKSINYYQNTADDNYKTKHYRSHLSQKSFHPI